MTVIMTVYCRYFMLFYITIDLVNKNLNNHIDNLRNSAECCEAHKWPFSNQNLTNLFKCLERKPVSKSLRNSGMCKYFYLSIMLKADVQSKNAVCANIKLIWYFHYQMSNFRQIHSRGIRFYGQMFDMVDTAYSYIMEEH